MNVVALHCKSSVFQKLGNYEEALKYLDDALAIWPDYTDGLVTKGVILSDLGKYDEAIECFDKALKIDPKSSIAWNNKGSALQRLENYQEALGAFNKSIDIDPKSSETWYNKGYTLWKLGKYPESIDSFNQASELCLTYSKLELQFFLEYLDKFIEIYPKDALVWFNKGVILKQLGKSQEALECLNKSRDLDPDFETMLKDKK